MACILDMFVKINMCNDTDIHDNGFAKTNKNRKKSGTSLQNNMIFISSTGRSKYQLVILLYIVQDIYFVQFVIYLLYIIM